MTRDEILKRFPNASRSLLKANLPFESQGQATVVESRIGNEPLAKSEVQEWDSPRFRVRIVSVRKRLLDEDNLCPKYHVDLCRYAGAIPNDAPGCCRIETTQRKAARGEEEHTEILIYDNRPASQQG